MKSSIAISFVLFSMFVTCLQGNEASKGIYPLKFEANVYPSIAFYGDIIFVSLKMINEGDEKIIIATNITRERGYDLTPFQLFSKESGDIHLKWLGEVRAVELATGAHHDTFLMPKNSLLLPSETIELCTRLLWVPPTSFIDEYIYKESGIDFSEKTLDCEIDVSIDLKRIKLLSFVVSRHEKLSEVDGAILFSDIENHGYRVPDTITLRTSLRIQPRLKEESELIRSWFLEVPGNDREWFSEPLFELLLLDRDSPERYPIEIRKDPKLRYQWYNDVDRWNKYEAFREKALNRTEYSLGRISKSKNIATDIITRSKKENSTISQNMVEFIQLRGFLVDMRYAENERAEQAAFEKLMNFVDTAGDRELWIRFLDEIGLYSIMHYTHFPSEKVEHYRELFARWFNEVKNLGLIE